jgi:arylsulfatase A-like enzyme
MGLLGRRSYAPAGRLRTRAAAIASQRRGRPLLLWVHYLDCHIPYRNAPSAPVPWRAAVALSSGDESDFEHAQGAQLQHMRDVYAHEVRGIDRAITGLLDDLGPPPARGRIVALVSDHGEELGEHGRVGHGHALWEEVVRVPMVVQGLGGPSVVNTPVGLDDLTATLALAAGLDWQGVGRDLRKPLAPRVMRSWNLLYGPAMSQTLRQGARKVVSLPGQVPTAYDLAADPNEAMDRAAEWVDWIGDFVQPIQAVQQADKELTTAERQLLEVLGYLE